MFPMVQGRNLEQRLFVLPRDFESDYNIVQLAFTEVQQYEVNTWSPFLDDLKAEFPEISSYELPTLPRFPWYQRMMLDYWMRTGIPNADIRSHTITLYLDVSQFLQAMHIPSTETIYTLMVDRRGGIHGREAGSFSPAKGAALRQIIASVSPLAN